MGGHRLHDVADEGLVAGARRREAGRLVAAPHDLVGGGFDLGHLVAVGDLLVAGEVEHARSGRAQRRADGEEHGVAQAAAHQHHGLARGRLRGSPRGPHEDHGLAGLRAARTGRSSRPSRARWWRRGRCSRSTHAPVRARPSMASVVASGRRAWPRNSAADRTGPGWNLRAAMGACTTTSTIFGVRRSTRCTVARSSRFRRAMKGARLDRRRARAGARARGSPPGSPAWPSPWPSPRCRRRKDAGRRRSSRIAPRHRAT